MGNITGPDNLSSDNSAQSGHIVNSSDSTTNAINPALKQGNSLPIKNMKHDPSSKYHPEINDDSSSEDEESLKGL